MQTGQWESAAEFFAMGGHGFFIWVSYAVAAIVMLTEAVAVVRRHAASLRQAAGRQRMIEQEADPS